MPSDPLPEALTASVPAPPPGDGTSSKDTRGEITLRDFQRLVRDMYYEKDLQRGLEGTFMWLLEEVGELAGALRKREAQNLREEFADVLAWLATIANVAQVDLADAIAEKYGSGCPGCGQFACQCPDVEKP